MASDLGMPLLTDNFLLSDVEPFNDTDVVDRSVSHAETPQASSFCMNEHVGPAGIPIQNIPSLDFCNPFMPQPYYYVPQHQQNIVCQYQQISIQYDPTNSSRPENENSQEHGMANLMELAEVATMIFIVYNTMQCKQDYYKLKFCYSQEM